MVETYRRPTNWSSMKAHEGQRREKHDCNLKTQKYTGLTNGLNLSRKWKKTVKNFAAGK